MFRVGDKVCINKSTEKLDKPDYRPYFGQTLTIQSQPYIGRFTMQEVGTLIFCDWMLEPASGDETKTRSKSRTNK